MSTIAKSVNQYLSNMILQRCIALSKTFHLLRQNITPAKSTVVILNPRFSFSDYNNDKNCLPGITTTQNESPSRSEDEERLMKLIQLEISSIRGNGDRAPNPENINRYQWNELLQLKTSSARKKYYAFLFVKEKMKENLLTKKQEKKEAFEIWKEARALEPNPWLNRFLLRILPKTMDKWYNNKLIQAMQFGIKLVFDCSYDSHMTRREASNAAKQLTLCFATNRRHREPFDLHFCNAIPDSATMKYLEQQIPTMRNKSFPLNLHEESYLDLFPKEKLVYLTPHCNVELVEYDPDAIYIIGVMVDKINNEPLSLGKAKTLGLRMARLPLDRYLKMSGGKSLTLDQMTKILLDIQTTRNWAYSLRHVPTRKIISDRVPQVKTVRKWTANVDKSRFDSHPQKDYNTVPIAEKFKKKIQCNNSLKFDLDLQKDDNTMSTADKFRQKIKWKKT